jgi:hypothetical protein
VWVIVVVASMGCRQLWGIETPQLSGDGGNTVDAGDAPPGTACFGTGLEHVCLPAAPSTPITFNQQTIDTDTDARCATTISITTAACVIVGTAVTVSADATVSGSRPLVVIASDVFKLDASGMLDASSSHDRGTVGAGANPSCPGGSAASQSAGGAGGSFGSVGGNGGAAANGGVPGTPAGPIAAPKLQGGCPGASGGGQSTGGGAGGGAIWIISTTRIEISGTINASGAGGGGGEIPSHGGCGGGAGGMIGLDAPVVVVNAGASVLANGGGGGEGGGIGSTGAAGHDPTSPTAPAAGGSGTSVNAGDGGDGAYATSASGSGVDGTSTGGGGGGGGGVGAIKIYGQASLAPSTVSPPPS